MQEIRPRLRRARAINHKSKSLLEENKNRSCGYHGSTETRGLKGTALFWTVSNNADEHETKQLDLWCHCKKLMIVSGFIPWAWQLFMEEEENPLCRNANCETKGYFVSNSFRVCSCSFAVSLCENIAVPFFLTKAAVATLGLKFCSGRDECGVKYGYPKDAIDCFKRQTIPAESVCLSISPATADRRPPTSLKAEWHTKRDNCFGSRTSYAVLFV